MVISVDLIVLHELRKWHAAVFLKNIPEGQSLLQVVFLLDLLVAPGVRNLLLVGCQLWLCPKLQVFADKLHLLALSAAQSPQTVNFLERHDVGDGLEKCFSADPAIPLALDEGHKVTPPTAETVLFKRGEAVVEHL